MRNFREPIIITGFLALALVLSALSHVLAAPNAIVSVWWPAAGVLAYVFARAPRRHHALLLLPVLFTTSLSSFNNGNPLVNSLMYGGSIAIEALIVGTVLRGRFDTKPRFDRLGTLGLLFAGSIIGPAIGAVGVGVTAFYQAGIPFSNTFVSYLDSHATADLLILPVILGGLGKAHNAGRLEQLLQWIVVIGLTYVVFGSQVGIPIAFFGLIPFTWTALRSSFRVLAFQIAAAGALAATLSSFGRGPFSGLIYSNELSAQLSEAYVVSLLLIFLPLAIVGSIQSRTQVALEDSEQLFHDNFDGALMGMAIVTVIGATSRAEEVNAAAHGMLGSSPEEHGFSILSKLAPESRERLTKAIDLLEKDQSKAWRGLVETLNSRTLDASVFPLKHAAHAGMLAIQLNDVTKSVLAEQSLRSAVERERSAASKLRDLDRIKSDLIASVSHELRTPLAGILGYAEILRDGDAGVLTEDQDRIVGIIENSGLRLSRVVDELLRASADEEELAPRRDLVTDGVEIAARVIAELLPVSESRGQSLLLQRAVEAANITAIPDELHKILINLTGNAIKYTPQGGNISLSIRADDDFVYFAVEDDGLGISPEDQGKIFSRFFRSGNGEGAVGTGIGLWLVDELVRRNGGTLDLESQLGVGSTFTVRFDRADKMASPVG